MPGRRYTGCLMSDELFGDDPFDWGREIASRKVREFGGEAEPEPTGNGYRQNGPGETPARWRCREHHAPEPVFRPKQQAQDAEEKVYHAYEAARRLRLKHIVDHARTRLIGPAVKMSRENDPRCVLPEMRRGVPGAE